jgi:hypothetical protein
VTLDDASGRRQPDSLAREFPLGMEAFEGLKEPASPGHIETRPIVSYVVFNHSLVLELSPKLDSARGAVRGVLPGVGQKIVQQDLNQPGVSFGLEAGSDEPFDSARRSTG